MRKKVMLRGALGFPLGIALGFAITIAISWLWADGHYAPCVPELVEAVGSEIGAVTVQALLSGLLGTGFAGASVIWDMERWSLVKQTGIYFTVISLVMLPVAYLTYWMEHRVTGFLSYLGMFALLFVLIWLVQLWGGRRSVKAMNDRLKRALEDGRQP